MSTPRRIGKFQISDSALYDYDLMRLVQTDMAVLRIDHELISATVTIWGVGEMFDLVQPAEIVPLYQCIFKFTAEGATCEFRRAGT